jgi:chromosomal replication initiator protein
MKMTSMDQERWLRVKDRLRIEVGEDIYLSWFARMELDAVETETIKLSVPTRFLKSWIQSHYAEKLLGCWQSEQPTTTRIELTVRSAAIRQLPPKVQPAELPAPPREAKLNGHTDAVTAVAFSPDGAQGLSSSNDKTLRLWTLPD